MAMLPLFVTVAGKLRHIPTPVAVMLDHDALGSADLDCFSRLTCSRISGGSGSVHG